MSVAKWAVWVEATRPDGPTERMEIATLERDMSSPTPDDLGDRSTRCSAGSLSDSHAGGTARVTDQGRNESPIRLVPRAGHRR